MGAHAYAAARNNERAQEAREATAKGLDTIGRAIDAQDAAIRDFASSAQAHIDAMLAIANQAEATSMNSLRMSERAESKVDDFQQMTLWHRLRWIATGKLSQ